MRATRRIPNARSELALHALAEGVGTPLLLIHPLAASADYWRARLPDWPGAVHALDLSGHGTSPPLRGRSYSAETLVGDVDAALAHLGRAIAIGAGLGAYLALSLAGARPDQLPVAVLMDGEGLAGGGAEPHHPITCPEPMAPSRVGTAHDPAVERLRDEIRPPAYARELADAAVRVVLIGRPRPSVPWWDTVAESPNAERAEEGLQPFLDALAKRAER